MGRDGYVARRDAAGFEEVSLGFRTVRLLPVAELSAAQEGYNGNGWSSDWLVVATEDELGDPIFVDLGADRLPVYTAAHGEGVWEPVQIADSFEGLVAALDEVAAISAGREHPVALEENPIPEAEREQILGRIRAANPDSDYAFWASWMET
jgi:hypothetical protein